MFGTVVMGIPHQDFEAELDSLKVSKGVQFDSELDSTDLQLLAARYKAVYSARGKDFPIDPYEQLYLTVKAVFESWNSDRAVKVGSSTRRYNQ